MARLTRNSTRRVVLAAFALAAAMPAQAQTSSPPTPMTILVYEAGPAWKAGRPMAEQGLGRHLGYVAAAFKTGKVVAYGTEDSPSKVRGYYVLKGAEMSEADAFVAADPGVASGALKRAGAHVWQVVVNGFSAKQGDQRYAILRMQPGPHWVAGKPLTEQDVGAHFGYMVDAAKAGKVLAAGPDGSGQEGWYVLRGDAQAVNKLLAGDPGVKSGVLKPVVVGWNVIDMQPAR